MPTNKDKPQNITESTAKEQSTSDQESQKVDPNNVPELRTQTKSTTDQEETPEGEITLEGFSSPINKTAHHKGDLYYGMDTDRDALMDKVLEDSNFKTNDSLDDDDYLTIDELNAELGITDLLTIDPNNYMESYFRIIGFLERIKQTENPDIIKR